MRIVTLGLALYCALAAAADKTVESGFFDALGITKSKVIEKILPETPGAKLYGEAMVLRYSQPLDSDKAFKLFLRGYEAGNASCAYELSLCYLQGIGVRRSQSTALKALSDGMLMKDGTTIDCELKWINIHMREVISLYDKTQTQGFVKRLVALSSHNAVAAAMLTKFMWSQGTPPVEIVSGFEHANAVSTLRFMSAAGDPYASLEYGKLLLEPSPVEDVNHPKFISRNPEEGLRLIKYAASKGACGAHYTLYRYYDHVDIKPATAFEWLEKGWASGDCISGYSLSYALIRGEGTAVDKKRAVEIALKVGEQGDAYQAYNVADLFTGYAGFDASLANFITWHRVAADKGNTDSADQLGMIYAGEEVIGFKVALSASVEEAFKYFQMAAYPDGEHSFVYRLNSLLYLGDMYRRGIGCEADPVKAAKAYLDYLVLFRKNNFTKSIRYEKGGKVRLLWLKTHFPNLPDIPGLDDPHLKFDEVVDYLYSFRHFAKYDFDYELFDDIAELMARRGPEEKKMFLEACTYVAESYGAKDALYHYGDIKYGKELNINSYEWYKYAALSGSPSAARRLDSMFMNHWKQRLGKVQLGPELGPESALRLWERNGELGVARREGASWRAYATSIEEDFNQGRDKKRDFRALATKHDFFTGYGDSGDPAIMRMIYHAQREQLAKEVAGR